MFVYVIVAIGLVALTTVVLVGGVVLKALLRSSARSQEIGRSTKAPDASHTVLGSDGDRPGRACPRPGCGQQVLDGQAYCPRCGVQVSAESDGEREGKRADPAGGGAGDRRV